MLLSGWRVWKRRHLDRNRDHNLNHSLNRFNIKHLSLGNLHPNHNNTLHLPAKNHTPNGCPHPTSKEPSRMVRRASWTS